MLKNIVSIVLISTMISSNFYMHYYTDHRSRPRKQPTQNMIEGRKWPGKSLI